MIDFQPPLAESLSRWFLFKSFLNRGWSPVTILHQDYAFPKRVRRWNARRGFRGRRGAKAVGVPK